MNKDHSVFKEKIISFFSFNQHCGRIICANMFIDWNWLSGERCGPWAFCFILLFIVYYVVLNCMALFYFILITDCRFLNYHFNTFLFLFVQNFLNFK